MRTITRTYDLFQLAELSVAAKRNRIQRMVHTFEYGWEQ